jgi:hypothetical protein
MYVKGLGTAWDSCNAELALQLLERDPFRFRVDEQHDKKLQSRHGCKKREGQSTGVFREYREN